MKNQDVAIIVASYGTFSTGINIRNIHNIVFSSPSKSKIRVLQSIGRGLRKTDIKNTIRLFDIVDDCSMPNNRINFLLTYSNLNSNNYIFPGLLQPSILNPRKVIYLEEGQVGVLRNHKETKFYDISNDSIISPTIETLETMKPNINNPGFVEALSLSPWIHPLTDDEFIDINSRNIVMLVSASIELSNYYKHCVNQFNISDGPATMSMPGFKDG